MILLAYLAGWESWSIADIRAEKLTHICYAFASNENGRVVLPDYAPNQLRSLLNLRSQHPHLKLLISVGGWQADGFSDAALTESARAVWIESILALIAEYQLDGVDLDWEYPSNDMAGIVARPEDRQNFIYLLRDLRAALPTGQLLTIAGGGGQFDLAGIMPYLDFAMIMSYDLYNGWAQISGHHSNLYPNPADPLQFSAHTAVQEYIAAGATPDKLVIGAAFYGRSLRGVNGLYQTGLVGSNSLYSYTDILTFPHTRYWDEHACSPYACNGDELITYDDPRSLALKAEYVKEQGLAGIMFWEYTLDKSGTLLDALYQNLKLKV
jgi:chitinase